MSTTTDSFEVQVKSIIDHIAEKPLEATIREINEAHNASLAAAVRKARIDELKDLITLLNAQEYRHSDEPSKALKFPNSLILRRIAALESQQEASNE